jgi:hypothetical protein
MVVQESLHELVLKYSGTHLLSAVPGISRQSNLAHAQRLGHGVNCSYFNAGLMLIDPQQWRQQRVKERCLQCSADSPERIRYADQDMWTTVLLANGESYRLIGMSWWRILDLMILRAWIKFPSKSSNGLAAILKSFILMES